jgi:hypothetical protein
MFTTNPAVVSDPVVLGFMHALVFGKLPGDDAAFGRGSPGDLKKLGPTIIAARAVNVEAGYASAYEEEGGSPEIGVFALRMKQISDEERSGLSHPPGKGIIKGPVAIYYWSDARADAPDRGCLDVVRQHIESLEFR